MDQPTSDVDQFVLSTQEHLDALPVGAVIRGVRGGVWEIEDPEANGAQRRYRGAGANDYRQSSSILWHRPFFVLWTPADPEAGGGPGFIKAMLTALRSDALRYPNVHQARAGRRMEMISRIGRGTRVSNTVTPGGHGGADRVSGVVARKTDDELTVSLADGEVERWGWQDTGLRIVGEESADA